MPTIVQTFQGKVTGLWGTANMRGADGKMRPLKVGDLVHQGDVILTSQDGIVQLSPDDTAAAQLAAATPSAPAASAAAASTTPEIDRVISGLDDPNSADATAAGVAGGDGAGDLSPGLRVDRIVESTTPASLTLPGSDTDLRPDLRGGAATAPEDEAPRSPTPIDADSRSINATEEGPAVALGLAAPTGTSSAAVITVTQLPLIGLLQKADGTPVAIGSVLTTADLTGLKYLPPADYDGSAPVGQFTYSVTDQGTTANGAVTIALGAINDAPVGNADTATTLEDTPVAGNVLANDRDADGDTLSVTQYSIAGVAHAAGTSTTLLGIGTLVLNANGAYTFTPAADYNGAVPQITYTLTDGTVTRTSTLTLAVTPVNDAPTAANDIASTAINAPVTVAVLANDSDRDGDPLTVTDASLANPAQGTVVVNADGSVTFTPANNVIGPVVVTYTVSDGHGGSASANITVNVGSNSAPDGADAARTTAEDTSYSVKTGDFGFADADAGQTLANVRIDTLPAAGTLLLNGAPVLAGTLISAADIAAGKLVFAPAPDANGAPYASFTFSVQDSAGAFDATPNTLTLNVTPVNDAPVAVADAATATEDTPVSGNVLANDSDVDATPLQVSQFVIAGTTYTAGSTATLAGIGTLVIQADGAYTFTPAANYNGPVPVATYTATDGTLTSTATLTIAVTPVNDAPTATDDLASTPINTPIVIGVLGNDTDADGDTLTVTTAALANPAQGTVTVNPNGTLNFTPANNVTGSVVITYTVSDGHGGTDTAIVTVNVGNNTPPTGADSAHTIAEDSSYTVQVGDFGFADADAGQTLAGVRIDTLPAAGSLLLNGTAVAAGAVISATELAAGHLVFVPAPDANGAPYANLTFSVQDSAGAFDAAPNTLTLNVTPVNDVPVAVADTVAAVEDTPFVGSVATNDTPSGDGGNVFSLVSGNGPTHGGIVFNADGTFTYTPSANYNGADTFTYSLTDANGDVSTATVSINIAAVNDAPLAAPDANSTLEDTPLIVDAAHGLLANDSDVDSASLSVTQFSVAGTDGSFTAGSTVAIAGVGSLTINGDGAYSFTPVADYNGPVPVATYTVSDGALTSTATLTLSVTPVNDAPTLSLDADHSHNTVSVQAIAGLFNTGESDAGSALALGTLDPHYTLVSAPAGATLAASATSLSYAWIPNDADSTWIGNTGDEPTGVYQYQTSFSLQPGADPASVNIAFDLASDNNLRDILVNGVSTGFSSNLQYGQYTHVELHGASAAFGNGLNTITFVVDNRDPSSPNASGPTGLRIDNISGNVAVIAPDSSNHLGDYATVYVEGTPVSIADADADVIDVDSPTLQSATITLTNAQLGDLLQVGTLPAGIVASVNAAGTVVTLTGAASQASYEAAIRAVQFDNSSENPSGAIDRLVTVVVNDGVANSNTVTTTVHVVPADDSPQLDLDGDDSTAAGTGYSGNFFEHSAGVAIVDADIAITDIDSAALRSASVRIANVQPGDVLTAGALPAGISAAVYDPASGVLTLSGTASPADYQAALAGIRFSNADANLSTVDRSVEISVNDGSSHSNVAVSVIHVAQVNDAPAGTDTTITTLEDTAHVLARGDFGFSDALDTPTNAFASVSVGPASTGTLALNGVAITATTLVSVAQLDAGLLTFTPAANTNGTAAATLQFQVRDDGGTANGGVDTDASPNTLSFDVTPVNDAPVNQVPGAQTVAEDASLVFSAANGNAITVADVDSGSLTVTLSSANGTLTLGSSTGVTVSGNGSGTLTLVGGAAAINAALNGSTFKNTGDYSGNAQISVSTSDGTAPAVQSTIGVTVTPVADIVADTASTFEGKPVTIDVNANDSFENAAHTVTAINGTAIAAGGSVAVANGSVLLQADGQLVFTPTAGYNTGNGAPTSFSYTVASGGSTETASVDVTVVPVNNAPTPTLAVTPVGRWTFDETTGTTTVDKYNARSGTLTDSTPSPAVLPTFAAGHTGTSGSALHFDGAGSQVALNAATTAPLMGTSSLSFWIKTTQTGSGNSSSWDSPAVIGSEHAGGGNDLQWGALNASGKIGFGLGNVAGLFSTTSVNDDAWHQVAITRDAVTKLVNVYVDGKFEASGSPNDAAFTAALNRLSGFGATNNFSNDAAGTDLVDNRFLRADLDDVRIYDHVLSADQVTAIRSVEAGYHDLAVANDGDATKITLTAGNYTALSVSGLNAGMVITDGTAGHTITSTSTDGAVDLTGWNLNSISVSGTGTGSALLAFNATDTVNGESHTATQYLNIVNGTSLIAGGTGNDTLNGTANADLLVGNAGNDTLNGGNGNDRLLGGSGNDTIDGGAGNDIIYGGSGNDMLTGGNGADTFAWKLADRGAGGAPATDTIADFNVASSSAGGDSLDLRDLLVGANHVGSSPGNLQSYLDFDTTSAPGSTIVHISSSGGFTGGTYSAAAEDQRIVLQGVDVRSPGAFGLAPSATDNDVIAQLLQRGKLVTDGP